MDTPYDLLEKADIEEIRKQVEGEVEEAHLFAKESPYPREDELSKYVFKE